MFTAKLDYPRSQSATGFRGADATVSPWRPWRPTYFSTRSGDDGVAPQAMLSDIAFDAAGNMTLGLRDRGADQTGYFALSDPSRPNARIEGFTAGDLLRAFAQTPGDLAGGWTLEDNGRGPNGEGAGPRGNSAGPGGGEFYHQENFGGSHGETSMGSLLQLPGRPDVASLQMDPATDARAGGLGWMNNSTGAKTKAYQIYVNGNANNANLEATFSKANGLGGLTALADLAPIEVGNRVYRDADRNGRQDPGEALLAGVTVQLVGPTGTVIATAVTDARGEYYFSAAAGTSTAAKRFNLALERGTSYTVRVPNVRGANRQALIAGLSPTAANAAGVPDAIDSDGVLAGDDADAAFLPGDAGVSDHTLDFGFQTDGTSVSGFIYVDENDNGLREGGDGAVTQSVTLTLTGFDALGAAVSRTVTTTTGAYTFANVPTSDAAGYTITQVNQPSDFLDGRETPGTPFGGTGGVATEVITNVRVDASTGAVGVDYNFGEIRPGVLGDFVWLDANGSGRLDAGEQGLPGVAVTLSGTTDRGTVTRSTASDANGNYLFDRLRPGTYTVTFGNAAGGVAYTRTFRNVGPDSADSDADRTTGAADPVTLALGGSDLTIDAGLFLPVSLGDQVWVDTNRDGTRQAGEPGIANAKITVISFGPDGAEGGGDDATTSVFTDSDGQYVVTGLAPGRFRVTADPTTGTVNGVPATGLTPTYDFDSLLANPDATTLLGPIASGDSDLRADFGFTNFPGALGDRVWLDRNGDGVQQAGEPGVPGVPVTATFLGADGVVGGGDDKTFTATTGTDGVYTFADLPLGKYVVSVNTAGTNLLPTADLDSPSPGGDNTASAALTAQDPTRTDVDFGLRGTASVGDLVWYDIDGDGARNNAEPGLAGVTVTLTASGRDGVLGTADDFTFVTTTDSNGNYRFDGLPVFGAADAYSVAVTPPAGYPTRTSDADGTGTPDQSTLSLAASGVDLNQDFGYRGPLGQGLGDTVWLDANGNGRLDAGESGLSGVAVELLDLAGNVLAGTTTANNPNGGAPGYYEFRGLIAGDYRVRFGNSAAGVTYTRTNQDSPVADDSNDSDASSLTGVTGVVSVAANTFVPTVDAGLYQFARLGDTVYRDDDGNRVQNGTEPGLVGVTVVLDDAGLDGVFGTADDALGLASVQTVAGGDYLFGNLRPGTYRVRVDAATLPPGLAPTADLDGLATPNAAIAAIASGQTRRDADFGYRGVNAIGDTVWYDLDRSGTQNNGEPGVAGVTVALTQSGADGQFGTADDVTLATRVTDAAGNYLFANLPAGSYRVVVRPGTLPAGLAATFDLDSGLANPDGAAVADLGGAGSSRLDVDFGYRGTGSVGDRVWFDANGDGNQDAGEPGLAGLAVTLTWAGQDGEFGTPDDLTRTATTGTNGAYLFADLPAGDYAVTVSPTPGLTQTGDPDAALDNASTVALAAGQNDLAQDFGYRGQSRLGGRVYVDLNDNGLRDAGEAAIPAVTVTLVGTDAFGNSVSRTAVTGADGTYLFADLAPGTYSVVESQPAAFGDGRDTLGTVNGVPVGGVGADRFDAIALGANAAGVGYDFGERGGVISGVVFLDRDRDGTRQPGEPAIPSVFVRLRDASGTAVATTTTAADGSYSFPGLPTGSYSVEETQPGGYGDSPTGPFAPNTRAVDLPPGAAVVDQNFGDTLGTIGGTVYADVDRNGVRNGAEPGLAGVTLSLLDASGTVIATTVTDAAGDYAFADLPAGTYSVAESQPAGFADGATAAGPAGGSASSGVLITAVPLAPGGSAPGNLFGEVGSGSVTGVVFLDRDRDGTRQPNEPGIPTVTVQLTTPDGTVIATTTTDANGNYRFDGVPPGNYVVAEFQPAGLGTTANTGGNVRAVSVVNGQTTVAPAFPNTLGSLSGTVYLDNNLSLTFDSGDAGLANVLLQLLDASGNFVASAVTDANGNYRFENLPAGDYTVLQTPIAGALYDGADNPGNFGGTSPQQNFLRFTLPAGGDATDYDFGEFRPAAAFGFVSVDANRNGVRDAGESGVAGVAVTVSGTAFAGTPFARPLVAGDLPGGSLTVLTDAAGRYEFSLLPPGLYSFREAQPEAFLDGTERDGDPATQASAVGNDLFSNVTLAPGQVRGPLDFGEFNRRVLPPAMPPAGPLTPIDFFPVAPPRPGGPLDPTKREFLGSTPGGVPLPTAPPRPTAPNSSTRTTGVTFVAVGEDVGGGLVRVFDYQSGVERYRFAPYPGFAGGVQVATGDVTGDGVPDIVTAPGVGGGPLVRVFDGVTGAAVREIMAFEEGFRGGLQLTVGDITGDGVADIVVAPDAGGGPIVRAFDGRTSAQVANFFALDEAFRGGLRIAASDLSGDGLADLVVTAGVGGGPRVAGYDGSTLTSSTPARLFGDFFAFASELRSGYFVTAGDVDGDGLSDILIGAGPGGGPRVASYSGRSLTQSNAPAVLGDAFAGDPASRGGVRVKAIDLDGDGRAELVSGTGTGERPVVRVTDPRTGAVRDEFYAFPTDFLGGVTVG